MSFRRAKEIFACTPKEAEKAVRKAIDESEITREEKRKEEQKRKERERLESELLKKKEAEYRARKIFFNKKENKFSKDYEYLKLKNELDDFLSTTTLQEEKIELELNFGGALSGLCMLLFFFEIINGPNLSSPIVLITLFFDT